LLFLSGSAKAKAAKAGIGLSDIEDDSGTEGEYEEQEEEDDEELEEDQAEADNMGKSTPAKKKSTPGKAAKSVLTPDDLADNLGEMSLGTSGNGPVFSMNFIFPYMLSIYNESVDIIVKIEVFTPLLPKDYFIPDVVAAGQRVEIRTRVPTFFYNEQRVIKSNTTTQGFNENTHEAQAFKSVCDMVDAHYGLANHVYGDKPMVIKLPFTCEERILSWECQAFRNKCGDLQTQLDARQYHHVLTIKCMKLKTKRRSEGAFRIIDSDDEEDMDD
jgi:hypothetical protein